VAGADRMTIEEVVRKVLLDEHADVIREAVKAVAAEFMELEVSELIGAERGERRPPARARRRAAERGRGRRDGGARRAASGGRGTARRIATAIEPGAGTPGRVRSSCRSRRSAK